MAQSAYVDLGNLENGTFTDARDGNTYGWRAIGDRVWMTENFAYEGVGEYAIDRFGNHCYSYRPVIGRVEGLNPEGWHVSTYEDWNELEQYAASIGITENSEFARSLAKVSDLWDYVAGEPPLNTLKFDMIPSDWPEIPTRALTGSEGRFWTSTLGPASTSEATSVYSPIVHANQFNRWDYLMEERSDENRGWPIRLVSDHDASLLSPNLDLVLEPLDLQEVQVTVEQDIVVGSLSLILEALDVRVDNNFATDFDWIYDHSMLNSEKQPVRLGPVNDRLIDIERWLPGAFQGTQLASFVRLFQDFLNEQLYEENRKYAQGKRGVSVLKKIERILDLRDPNEIDEEFLYQYANLLGFDVHTLQALTTSLYKEDGFNHTRELLKSAPVIFSNKATEKMYNLILASFGHYIKITGLWTDNEDNYANGVFKTYSEIKGSDSSFAPTPHFGVVVDISKQDSEWTPTSEKVLGDTIEYFRPIDTVYEGTLLTYGSPFFFSRLEDGENTRNGMELTVLKPWALTSCGFDPSLFPKIKWWIDPRDGQMYPFENINGHAWLTANMNFGEADNESSLNEYGKKRVNPNWPAGNEYGGLYSWETANQTCPYGWHVPWYWEIESQMRPEYGENLGSAIKAEPDAWDGTDETGFRLLPAGYYGNSHFYQNGSDAYFWTNASASRTIEVPDNYNVGIGNIYDFGVIQNVAHAVTGSDDMNYSDMNVKVGAGVTYDCSLRIKKDEDSDTYGVFVDDRDGQVYRWIKYGNLYWMVDNLNYGELADNITSGEALGPDQAWSLTQAQLLRNIGPETYPVRTGKAYTRENAENAIPPGGDWRLPDRKDWENLRDVLVSQYGGQTTYPVPGEEGIRRGWRTSIIGKKMKTDRCYLVQGDSTVTNIPNPVPDYGSDWYGLPTGWSRGGSPDHNYVHLACWLCADVYEAAVTSHNTIYYPTCVCVVDYQDELGGNTKDSYMFFYGDNPFDENGEDLIGDMRGKIPLDYQDGLAYSRTGFPIRCVSSVRPRNHLNPDPATWYRPS